MLAGIRFYAVAAAIVLVAASLAFLFADKSAGTLRLLAGILFWGSGLTLTGIGVLLLGRRLGLWPRAGSD